MLLRSPLAAACLAAVASALVLPAAAAGDTHRLADATRYDAVVVDATLPDAGLRRAVRPDRGVPDQLRSLPARSRLKTWRVVPGVVASTWSERDARGPVRFSMITVRWRTAGVSLDYANAGAVRQVAPVRSMIARDRAVAGINGDFFDRSGTGAPLGLGVDRERGLLNGRTAGWNSAFYVTADGEPEIGLLGARARIKERPDLVITSVNAPEVDPDGIGLYDRAWGQTAGYQVSDGQQRRVRAVLVRDGRVVSNTTRLPRDTRIDDALLVGRGAGARKLASLQRRSKVTLRSWADHRPRMAITGNTFLVRDGRSRAIDNRMLEPRTAIGIDRDRRTVIMLVVDGRHSFSRGYTMVELAAKMLALGADDALNLDGGGSSTMLTRRPNAVAKLVNVPVGDERAVANGVEVLYKRRR